MREWSRRMPWWVRFLIFTLTSTSVLLLFTRGSRLAALPNDIVLGAFFGTIETVLITLIIRANLTPDASLPLAAALQRGEPEGLIDPVRWLEALDRRAVTTRRARRWTIGWAIFALACLGIDFAAGNGRDSTEVRIIFSVGAALFVGLAIVASRDLPRIARLQARIREIYRIEDPPAAS